MCKITLPLLALIVGILPGAGQHLKAQTVFSYTGAVQTYVVPTGVSSLTVDAIGASGGIAYSSSSHAGAGGRVQCDMAVTPGQVLYVFVGGAGAAGSTGSAAGGWNGGGNSGPSYGGGGGGGSDIRSGGTALSNRQVVAAAGGGAGYDCLSSDHGGYGGGLSGEAGYSCGTNTSFCQSGEGGTQTGGGISATCYPPGGAGSSGVGAVGSSFGGGGGGGYFGGGGGAYAGGGGGSSFTNSSVITGITLTPGYNTSGNGSVTLTPCSLPTVGAIGGTTTVMVGASQTLTDATTGGVWASSNTAVATVGTSGVYTGIAAGTAVISYSVTNACGTSSVNTTITITASSLSAGHVMTGNISVYPNPSAGIVNINWTNQQAGSSIIKVTDITGREVHTTTLSIKSASGTKQLDLSGLADGHYVISITGDRTNYVGKLLLQK